MWRCQGVRVSVSTSPRSLVPSRSSLSVSIPPRVNIVRDLEWNEEDLLPFDSLGSCLFLDSRGSEF